ncbi:MAG: hypothetical protein N2690_04890, partial [Rhodocyclaceae bacterium]|nr:hypothetical protein [Rhodocyclaceae bacterium]
LLGAGRVIETNRIGRGHEVEITFRLAEAMGIEADPGPLIVRSAPQQENALRAALQLPQDGATLAVHISARKAKQRWPIEHYAALIRQVVEHRLFKRILLFWAPGPANDPLHPGDDEKAHALLAALGNLPVLPLPTRTLPQLIAGLALADYVVCSDGGAMHIAAGLGKPIVCFFGNSSAERWHPWGVSYELLQKPSQDVADISVDEAVAAVERLRSRCL